MPSRPKPKWGIAQHEPPCPMVSVCLCWWCPCRRALINLATIYALRHCRTMMTYCCCCVKVGEGQSSYQMARQLVRLSVGRAGERRIRRSGCHMAHWVADWTRLLTWAVDPFNHSFILRVCLCATQRMYPDSSPPRHRRRRRIFVFIHHHPPSWQHADWFTCGLQWHDKSREETRQTTTGNTPSAENHRHQEGSRAVKKSYGNVVMMGDYEEVDIEWWDETGEERGGRKLSSPQKTLFAIPTLID